MVVFTRVRQGVFFILCCLVLSVTSLTPLFSPLASAEGLDHWTYFIDGFGNAHSPSSDVSTPSKIKLTVGFPASSAKVFADYNNLFTIDEQGKVYGTGDNSCGVLGDPNIVGEYVNSAVEVSGITGVVDLMISRSSLRAIYALKSDGTVWSWGCNKFLGRTTDPTQAVYPYPQQISTLVNITQLATGTQHVLAMTGSGLIYAWGDGSSGQTGLIPQTTVDAHNGGTNVELPQQIPGLSDTVKITAGDASSFALLNNGTVMQWGKMSVHENMGQKFPAIADPQSVQDTIDIVNIDAGSDVVYLQKADGTAYGFGADLFGSLGATSSSQPQYLGQYYTYTPIPIPALDGASQLWASRNHVVAKIGNQLIALGGYNESHCTSTCDLNTIYDPYPLALDPAVVLDFDALDGDTQYIISSIALTDLLAPVLGSPSWTKNPKGLSEQSTLSIPVSDSWSGVAGGEGFLCGEDPGEHNGFPFEFDGSQLSFFVNESIPEGNYDICYRAFDNAGNVSTIGQTTLLVGDNIDVIPPLVVGSPDRAPNTNGWYKAPVTINWGSNDPAPSSGTPSIPAPTVANLQGTNHYISGQSCDPQNNCATGSYQIKLDSVLPGGAFTGTQAVIRLLGRTISGNSSDTTSGVTKVTLTAGATTLSSDPGGGLTLTCNATYVSCTWTAIASRLPFGVNTYTLKVTDLAGNEHTVTRQYTVI